MTSLKKVYSKTFQSIKSNPVLLAPFAIFACFELIALVVVYLAPRMPLKIILGPPIRALWGENFLHYPINFLLIPKLAAFARIGLTVIIGSLLTGVATILVYNIYKNARLSLKDSFKSAVKKYISLFTIVLLFTLIFYAVEKISTKVLVKYFVSGHTRLFFLGPKIWLGPILICLNFALVILIQSAFIYVIPILMIEGEKLTKSILRSFVLFKKLFVKTIILVGLPMLVYIPIIVLQSDNAFLIDRVFPEAVLLVSILSTLVSSLIVDCIITISATNLYLMNRDK
jgi:hypothetical protein